MKHLNKAAAAFAALATVGLSSPPAQAADFAIDTSHAFAQFSVNHLGYSNMLGRFNKFTGDISFDEGNVAASKVNVTIETASIDTNHEKRDAHLRSPDFFNTGEFPTMTFTSTRVEKTGERSGKVTGNLTLLGVTKPVTLDVTFNKAAVHPFDGAKPADQQRFVVGFSATGAIKRSDFGMKYALPAVGDTISLQLEAEAIRK